MSLNSRALLLLVILSLFSATYACAFGEGILAHTGQYSFFIKPDPCLPVTYYQKLVPCVAEDTVPVPRPTMRVYPVPIPRAQKQPTIIAESPVGCAEGSGHCLQCFPQASTKPGRKEVIVPQPIPVPVAGIEMVPKRVTRRVLRPQWFEVAEIPAPPKPIRKVGRGG